MKDGAIIANSGHFNVEIDIPALEKLATSSREVRPFTNSTFWATAAASICWAKGA